MLQNAAVKALVPRTLTPTWETWPMALALGSCPVWASGFLSRVVWARVNLWAPVQCEPLGSYPGWSRSAWASGLLPRVVQASVSLWPPAQGGPGQYEPLGSCPVQSRPVWASEEWATVWEDPSPLSFSPKRENKLVSTEGSEVTMFSS